MARTDRIYRIESLIRSRRHIGFKALLDELEVSPATLKRDLAYLRDRLCAPIEYDRELNAYRFGTAGPGPRYELPGLWFSEPELYSLLASHQLLDSLDGNGVLARHLKPLQDRIRQLLGADGQEADALLERVQIVNAARRPVPSRYFELLGDALLRRRRVRLRYLTRGRGVISSRQVSPQRLIHYRGTWYLDAWCHARQSLRRFSLDAIRDARVLDQPAREVPIADVEAAMDAGYGAYGGAATWHAALRFSPTSARWVAHEIWHPEQRGEFLSDGSYRLEIAYADPTELAMDVMRHGDQVAIVQDDGPLTAEVARRARAAWEALGRIQGSQPARRDAV